MTSAKPKTSHGRSDKRKAKRQAQTARNPRSRINTLINKRNAEIAQNRRWLMTERERPDGDRILSNDNYHLLMRKFCKSLYPVERNLPQEALDIWWILEAERKTALELQGAKGEYAQDWWDGPRKKGVKPEEARKMDKEMNVRRAEIRERMKLEGQDGDGQVRSEANALEARMDVWFQKFCDKEGLNVVNDDAARQDHEGNQGLCNEGLEKQDTAEQTSGEREANDEDSLFIGADDADTLMKEA
ncbi:MAG: hypothetical protein Q9225_003140 [Loekoesia sp. 1 TL-2023]